MGSKTKMETNVLVGLRMGWQRGVVHGFFVGFLIRHADRDVGGSLDDYRDAGVGKVEPAGILGTRICSVRSILPRCLGFGRKPPCQLCLVEIRWRETCGRNRLQPLLQGIHRGWALGWPPYHVHLRPLARYKTAWVPGWRRCSKRFPGHPWLRSHCYSTCGWRLQDGFG